MPVGGHVLLVCPLALPPTLDKTDFIKLILQRCAEVESMLVGKAHYRQLNFEEATTGVWSDRSMAI